MINLGPGSKVNPEPISRSKALWLARRGGSVALGSSGRVVLSWRERHRSRNSTSLDASANEVLVLSRRTVSVPVIRTFRASSSATSLPSTRSISTSSQTRRRVSPRVAVVPTTVAVMPRGVKPALLTAESTWSARSDVPSAASRLAVASLTRISIVSTPSTSSRRFSSEAAQNMQARPSTRTTTRSTCPNATDAVSVIQANIMDTNVFLVIRCELTSIRFVYDWELNAPLDEPVPASDVLHSWRQ
jgi:hypothetical protein